MEQIQGISNNLFESILPCFGNQGNHLPVWNEGQKMFISSEYETPTGNRYYKGLRFCEQLAIVEIVGLYQTWTYIDCIEIYAFDGKFSKLVGKRQFDKVFYDQNFIKLEVKQMLQNYIQGQLKLQNASVPALSIHQQVENVVDRSYVSFLSDDYSVRMQEMLPMLCASNH